MQKNDPISVFKTILEYVPINNNKMSINEIEYFQSYL